MMILLLCSFSRWLIDVRMSDSVLCVCPSHESGITAGLKEGNGTDQLRDVEIRRESELDRKRASWKK